MTDAADVTTTSAGDTGTNDAGAVGGQTSQPGGEPTAAGTSPAGEAGLGSGLGSGAADNGANDAPAEEQQKNEWVGAPDEGTGYTSDGIQAPDGMEIDDNVAEALAGACAEMGLSQKSFANIINKVGPVLQQSQKAALKQFRSDNLNTFANDPELGGSKAQANIETAKKAYQKWCPADAQDILVKSGLDTHPGIIRMFYNIAQAMSDDTAPRGNGGASGEASLARFFNNSKMN